MSRPLNAYPTATSGSTSPTESQGEVVDVSFRGRGPEVSGKDKPPPSGGTRGQQGAPHIRVRPRGLVWSEGRGKRSTRPVHSPNSCLWVGLGTRMGAGMPPPQRKARAERLPDRQPWGQGLVLQYWPGDQGLTWRAGPDPRWHLSQ